MRERNFDVKKLDDNTEDAIKTEFRDLQDKINQKGLSKGEKSRLTGKLRNLQEKADLHGIKFDKKSYLKSDEIEKRPKNIWDDVKRQADRIYDKKGRFVAKEAEARKRSKDKNAVKYNEFKAKDDLGPVEKEDTANFSSGKFSPNEQAEEKEPLTGDQFPDIVITTPEKPIKEIEIDEQEKIVLAKEKLAKIFHGDNNLQSNSNHLNLKNMRKSTGEASMEEAYQNEFQKDPENDTIDVYAKVNKESELEKEQEKAEEVYGSDFKNREKILENEKDSWEKLRKKDDMKKEKRAAELKEKEEFKQAYKRQFGMEYKSVDNGQAGNKESVANIDTPDNNAPVEDERDLKKIIREREKNMSDKIDDKLIDEDLEKSAKEIKKRAKEDFPELAEIIDDEKKPIQDLLKAEKIKNSQLEKAMDGANEQLLAIESKLNDKIIEISAEEDKEKAHKTLTAVKKFLSKPKVRVAIAVGLMGAAYTVGGGAPVILALKPLLAKFGIGFIPYTYGISSWGGGAIAGASGRWLVEKIGLVKNKKDARDAVKDFAIDLKGVANNENIKPEKNNFAQVDETKKPDKVSPAGKAQPEGQKSGGNTIEKKDNNKLSPEDAVRYYEENKTKGNNELDLDEIKKMLEAIKPRTGWLSFFNLTDEQEMINRTENWLQVKQDELEKQQAWQRSNEQKPPVAGNKEKLSHELNYEENEKINAVIKEFTDLYNEAKVAGNKELDNDFGKKMSNFHETLAKLNTQGSKLFDAVSEEINKLLKGTKDPEVVVPEDVKKVIEKMNAAAKSYEDSLVPKPKTAEKETVEDKKEKEYIRDLLSNFHKKLNIELEKFVNGKLDGEGVLDFATEISKLLYSKEAKESEELKDGYLILLRSIKPEIKAKMVKEMVDFGKGKGKNDFRSEHLMDFAHFLTGTTKEELKTLLIKDYPETWSWLNKGKETEENKETQGLVEKIKEGLEQMRKNDKAKFNELESILDYYSKSEESVSSLFDQEMYDDKFKDTGIKYEDVKDIKMKYFVLEVKGVYDEVKNEKTEESTEKEKVMETEKPEVNVIIEDSIIKNTNFPKGANIKVEGKSIIKEGQKTETAEEIREKIDGLEIFLKAQAYKTKSTGKENIVVVEGAKKEIEKLRNKLEAIKNEKKNIELKPELKKDKEEAMRELKKSLEKIDKDQLDELLNRIEMREGDHNERLKLALRTGDNDTANILKNYVLTVGNRFIKKEFKAELKGIDYEKVKTLTLEDAKDVIKSIYTDKKWKR